MKNWLVVLLAVIVAVAILGSGSEKDRLPSNKMTAEEAGYEREFFSIRSACRNDAKVVVEARGALRTQERLQDAEEVKRQRTRLNEGLARLRACAASMERFDAVEPPTSMTSLHQSLKNLLQTVAQAETFEPIESACLEFYQCSNAFAQLVKSRPVQKLSSDDFRMTFRPRALPVKIGSDGTFDLDLGFDTPFGDVSLERKWQGVRHLDITYEGKTRYFSLERDFNFSLVLPPGFNSLNIAVDSEKGLVRILITRTDGGSLTSEPNFLPPETPAPTPEQAEPVIIRVTGNRNRFDIQHSSSVGAMQPEYEFPKSGGKFTINVTEGRALIFLVSGKDNRISACCEKAIQGARWSSGSGNYLTVNRNY